MTETQRAPVESRIYLTGTKPTYRVLVKDATASCALWEAEVPNVKIGNAIVRALREQDGKGGLF